MKTLLINLFLLSLIVSGVKNSNYTSNKPIEEISNDFHSIQNADVSKDKPTNTDSKKKISLSKDSALDIVLKDAGVSKNDISNLKIEPDYNAFDIEFNTNQNKYDYEVSVSNSKIINKEVDKIVIKQDAQQSSDIISKDKALLIALQHVNLDKNVIKNLEVELDKDKYEIEFNYDHLEYSFEINAINGEIIEFEKDK